MVFFCWRSRRLVRKGGRIRPKKKVNKNWRAIWRRLGRVLRTRCEVRGTQGVHVFDVSGVCVRSAYYVCVPFCTLLVPFWWPIGALLAPFWSPFGPLCLLVLFWFPFGSLVVPFWSPFGSLLAPFWSPFGRRDKLCLERLGPFLAGFERTPSPVVR